MAEITITDTISSLDICFQIIEHNFTGYIVQKLGNHAIGSVGVQNRA